MGGGGEYSTAQKDAALFQIISYYLAVSQSVHLPMFKNEAFLMDDDDDAMPLLPPPSLPLVLPIGLG